MKKPIDIIIYALLALLTTACQDDFDPKNDFEDLVGDATINLDSYFYPEQVADLNSRAADGDSFDEIENLFVAFYDTKADSEALQKYFYFNKNQLEISQNGTGGADNDPICKATAEGVTIPYGNYYVVAVANMGDISGRGISTLSDIRSLQLDWMSNVLVNKQMSGYFSNTRLSSAPASMKATAKPMMVTINRSTSTIHAWLRRAVSKVTVDFDGSGMNNNIWVYIRSIRIKDIAPSMKLLDESKVTNKATLIARGDSLVAGQGNDFHNWPYITRGENQYKKFFDDNNPHSRTSSGSLFFYENMIGGGKTNGFKSKHQVDPDKPGASPVFPSWPGGVDPTDEMWKDGVECGTYVEVEAYYVSQSAGNHTKGPITYRFMLGKDVDYDYNAERNYHYKLTLCFKGNANDVDWHIDYREDAQFWAPSPYYISYLYNKSMYLPIQTHGNVARIDAKIVENHWEPSGETEEEIDDLENTLLYGYPVYYKGAFSYTSPNSQWASRDSEVPDIVSQGFLSLRYEGLRSVEGAGNEFNQNPPGIEAGVTYVDNWWHSNNMGYRTYYNPHINNGQFRTQYLEESNEDRFKGVFYVEDESIDLINKRYVFQIPLYTRALNMTTNSKYTGNNPFYSYVRRAKVRLRAFDSDGYLVKAYDPKTGEECEYLDIDIIQVRRVTNPKAIYRHASNAEPFHIVLKERKGEIHKDNSFTEYVPIKSHGAWSARVVAGADWVLIGKGAATSAATIYGDTETEIDFWYKPAGTIAKGQQRHGVIEVTYHNNTCVHTIIVKQGYAPTRLISGRGGLDADNAPHMPRAYWSNFNMRSKREMAHSPLEEGSYFRRGRNNYPIDPQNLWSMKVKDVKQTFTIYGTGEQKTWKEINYESGTNFQPDAEYTYPFRDWTYSESSKGNYPGKYHVAELQDYFYLRNERTSNDVAPDIDIAYGIVYGDGATECQSSVELAHEYKYTEADEDGDYPRSVRGMRGCLVYNNGHYDKSMQGACVFFPGGATGYGTLISNSYDGTANAGGRLGYGGASPIATYLDPWRPLMYRHDISMGMIYWHRRLENCNYTQSNGAMYQSDSWDFNMTYYDFNTYGRNGNMQAAMVRMVLNTEDPNGYDGEGNKYKSSVGSNELGNPDRIFPTYPY